MPKTTTAAPDVFWTTRVPAELDAELEHAAAAEDRTKAAIVRRAVEQYLNDRLANLDHNARKELDK
jgi:predicted transcriptional regulator